MSVADITINLNSTKKSVNVIYVCVFICVHKFITATKYETSFDIYTKCLEFNSYLYEFSLKLRQLLHQEKTDLQKT